MLPTAEQIQARIAGLSEQITATPRAVATTGRDLLLITDSTGLAPALRLVVAEPDEPGPRSLRVAHADTMHANVNRTWVSTFPTASSWVYAWTTTNATVTAIAHRDAGPQGSIQ